MLLGYIDPGSGFTIVSLGGWILVFFLGFFGIFSLFFKKIFRFFKKHKKIIGIILLIIFIVGVIMIGVIMNKKESAFAQKVIILGFDGLSPHIVESMMQEGKLPNFSRLKQQGSYRRLLTTNPSQSPVAWAGFATGKNPGKHGVYDFIKRDPQSGALSLSLSNIEKAKPQRVIKGKCFWNYTSQMRVPTVIIGCPVTFPPDKVYGRMLSGMGVPDILGTEGTFTFYTTESLDADEDIGGKVFQIKKSSTMVLNLIGPRVATPKGAENVKVPFKVTLHEAKKSVDIEYQNEKHTLKVGQWSDWSDVAFRIGLLKKAKGIFKFYLVETTPHFKLYISPINFDPRSPFFQISYPHHYSKELAEAIGLYYTQGMPMDTWAVNEKRLPRQPFLEQIGEVLREKKAMLDFELNRLKEGVLFCYFESSDIIQHMFWRYLDSEHPLYVEDVPQEYKEMIGEWYKKMDDILGELMQTIGTDDTLIVLSDHGFDTFRRAVHVNSWLRKNGYLTLIDPYASSGAELLRDINWLDTKAYALGFGAIYINQKGRERTGIVEPGLSKESLKEDISQKL
ncbi:MAG: alkaline phosphatase family protein [Candidatus Omnitrophota bacterium]|nr:MAG: alkaline phosphatase family protein [Candidatus Omnitrophota bacterium]